jgi:hypothetical protein
VVEPLNIRRRQYELSQTGLRIVHTGGVLAATRRQGDDGNWRSPVCPREKSLEKVGSITVDTGKEPKANRMAEWPIVALKSGNADGAKGPC